MSDRKTVRIGCASAFFGDASIATPQLLAGGRLDYLVFDYLAEVTMSVLAKMRAKNPQAGYADHFANVVVGENIREIAARKVKLVTNAGGVNPAGLRDALQQIAAAAGVSLRIAVVLGDDLLPMAETLRGEGVREMFFGTPLPGKIMSMNAYLGARPIAEALAAGADIVLTGRCVDSALTLGPLMHEFGWKDTDFDLLAAGSLAGHIIECGAQATGGLHTDWEKVPDWENIGYPVLECFADGSFVVTKPEGTGGIVTPATVAEQLLYEIGDPQAYLLPDVACDFTRVTMEQIGPDRVLVKGTIGRPPTSTYKVCTTFQDGYRAIGITGVVGIDAARKAERTAEALLKRTREMFRQRNLGDYTRTWIETLGAESSYGPHARTRDAREVVLKLAVEHEDPKALAIFTREWAAPMTSMSPGTTGWLNSGRPPVSPVVRLYSFLLDKRRIAVTVDVDGVAREVPVSTAGGFDPAAVERPAVVAALPAGPRQRCRLIDIAWGRSGDKGDNANIGLIARHPELLPAIREQVTAERVQAHFAYCGVTRVERWDLPGIAAVNLLLHNALGGGGMASLRLDPLAKSFAQQLLDMEIDVPAELLRRHGLQATPRGMAAA